MADQVDLKTRLLRGSIIRSFVAGMPFSIRQGILQGMRIGVNRIVKVIRIEKLSGQLLNKRTGTLARSVFGTAEDLGDDVIGVVGSDLKKAPYGRSQELGATIKPVRVANLTIPLSAVLTGKGVARFSARDVISNPQGYGYTGTFFRKGPSGKTILFGTKKGEIVPLFVLEKQTVIKPVGYIGVTVREQTPNVKQDILRGAAGALHKLKIDSSEAGGV